MAGSRNPGVSAGGGGQSAIDTGQDTGGQDKPPVISTTILVRKKDREWHSHHHARPAKDRNGGSSGDWYRRGLQISAALGLAFNFMHHQLRIRAVSRQHRGQHQQGLPACLYVSGLGLQGQIVQEPPSCDLQAPSAAHAAAKASTNQPPSLEDLERLEYDPLKLDAYLLEDEEMKTEEEGCAGKEDDDDVIDWDELVGKRRASDTMAAIESEIASLADTHQGLRLVVSGNLELGKDLLLKAAKAGNSEAMYNLGVIYEQDGKDRLAMRFYQAASELDYAAAFFNLAVFHEQGKAGLQPSSAAAIALYKKAARLGLPEAVAALRDASVTVPAAEQDKKKPASKDKGKRLSPDQLYQLARAYHYGLSGMGVDKHHAAHLYRLASEQGHKRSKRAYTALLQEFLHEAEQDKDLCNGKEIMISNSGF